MVRRQKVTHLRKLLGHLIYVIPRYMMWIWIVPIVPLLVLLKWWLRRPILHRAASDEFGRYIDGLNMQGASTSKLLIEDPTCSYGLWILIHRIRNRNPSLFFEIPTFHWPQETTESLKIMCEKWNLEFTSKLQKSSNSEKYFSVRIPNGSPVRAAELARVAFRSVGGSNDSIYRLRYEGNLDLKAIKKAYKN